ncbi:hypothetical protein VTN02DRAFT_5056 [Thermoascus thermophilus]
MLLTTALENSFEAGHRRLPKVETRRRRGRLASSDRPDWLRPGRDGAATSTDGDPDSFWTRSMSFWFLGLPASNGSEVTLPPSSASARPRLFPHCSTPAAPGALWTSDHEDQEEDEEEE